MGLNLEELRPITPIRVAAISTRVSNVATTAELKELHSENDEEEEEECRTPKSEDQILRTPLVCPPAPRKPRPAKRKSSGTAPREFFHVPYDLASVFRVLSQPSKKMRSN